MKTSEFIKFFEDEGYKVHESNVIITVEDKYRNDIIDILKDNSVDTNYCAFDNLPFEKQQEYYKVIFEYLMTPPEEREEEKKYYLRHKGFLDGNNILNLEIGAQNHYTSDVIEYTDFKTQFTQSEIDEMPECYTHPAVWEQIPVKEINQ